MSKELATSQGIRGFRAARAVLAVMLALSLLVPAAAPALAQPPDNPHYFFGTVKTSGGVALPAGTPVTASALGTQRGQTTVDAQGRYGYNPLFYIPADIPDGTAITFYVSGFQAQLYDVATGQSLTTYPFLTGGFTNLNLIADVTVPIQASVGPGGGGTITPSGTVQVVYGTNKGFTVAHDAGHAIDNVLVDGTSVGALTAYTFNNVTTTHTIQANFRPLAYTITPSAGAGGTISPSAPISVTHGGSATFTITPNTGFDIADVLVDGNSVGAVSTHTFNNVITNHTIAASFKVKNYTITPSAGTGGSISPNTPQTVPHGGSVTFTITPNTATGYEIADVLVDGTSVGAVATYAFNNVTGTHTIAASFKLKTYTITPTAGSGGSISPNTPQTVTHGGSATFTITPDAAAGYEIANVLVDGASVGAVATYAFNNVTATHTIAASFKLKTYTITPTAGTGGMIVPGTVQTVQHGGNATFSIVPANGYVIGDVKVDGISMGVRSTYQFNNVVVNHTIEAVFVSTPTQFQVYLPAGWNYFSTPVLLASEQDTLPMIFSAVALANIEIVYRWDTATSQWVPLDGDFRLMPLDAIAVKVKADASATAQLTPSRQLSAPPSRNLGVGLNLIGPAPAFEAGAFPAMPVAIALASVEQAPGGLQGYSMVISHGLNQPSWSYVRGMPSQDVLAYKGYWAIMENADTLYGFSSTPIAP